MRALEDLAGLAAAARCCACGTPGPHLCRDCRSSLRPAPAGPLPDGIDRVVAAWAYEGAARALVLRLKLSARRTAAPILAAGITSALARTGSRATVVTWVPGHRPDMRARGFDHGELLARTVAARLGLPARALLTRIGSTADQTGLGAAARRANLAGAFGARPGAYGQSVLLVDDVVTTGATAAACASALRAGGASQVDVAAACRA